MATEPERNKALVLQLYREVWNNGNLGFVSAAVSPDFQDHPPTSMFKLPVTGHPAISETVANFRGAIPDYHDEMIQCVAEDDRVVYLGRITGTHSEKFFQFPPSGNKVNVLGIHDYRLENGKIIERWAIFDVMAMMVQMGIVPAAGH